MARPIEFESWVEDGLYTYRYTSQAGGPFERNWPGLFEGEWPEHGPTPMTEFAVNNNNCEEVAIYLGLIWRLTEGLVPYGVPRYHRDDAMYSAGAPYAMVRWEYEVGDGERGDVGEIRGFVPARSSVRMFPPPSIWEQEHKDMAGFFELPVFVMLKGVVSALLADASAELNIYALEQWTAPGVVEALNGPSTPDLAEFLGDEEIFIDLVIGVDAENSDAIVVRSKSDLGDLVFPLAAEYDAAIEAYEADLDKIKTMPAFLDRLGKMLDLGDELDLSRFAVS